MWCSVGQDVANGIWAIHGARLGCYMTNCTDWDYVQVRDFEYLTEYFNNNVANLSEDVLQSSSVTLGNDLRSKLNLPVADLDATQSKFFKEVWINPSRTNTALTEREVTWDL